MPALCKKLLFYGLLLLGLAWVLVAPSSVFTHAQQAYAKLSQQWQSYINSAVGDPSWNQWDCEIQAIVRDYNQHLTGTKNFRPLDWQLIKALVWVESGAGSS